MVVVGIYGPIIKENMQDGLGTPVGALTRSIFGECVCMGVYVWSVSVCVWAYARVWLICFLDVHKYNKEETQRPNHVLWVF